MKSNFLNLSLVFLLLSCANLNKRKQVETPIRTPKSDTINCLQPAPEFLTQEFEAKASLGKIEEIAKASISAERKVKKLREVVSGLTSFEVLEYRFCTMYANGVITQERYNELIDKVLPLVVNKYDAEINKVWEKIEEAQNEIKLFIPYSIYSAYNKLTNAMDSVPVENKRLKARIHRIMAGLYLASMTCTMPYNPIVHKAEDKEMIGFVRKLGLDPFKKSYIELKKSVSLDKKQADISKLISAMSILEEANRSGKGALVSDMVNLWALLINSVEENSKIGDHLIKFRKEYDNASQETQKEILKLGLPPSPDWKQDDKERSD